MLGQYRVESVEVALQAWRAGAHHTLLVKPRSIGGSRRLLTFAWSTMLSNWRNSWAQSVAENRATEPRPCPQMWPLKCVPISWPSVTLSRNCIICALTAWLCDKPHSPRAPET